MRPLDAFFKLEIEREKFIKLLREITVGLALHELRHPDDPFFNDSHVYYLHELSELLEIDVED